MSTNRKNNINSIYVLLLAFVLETYLILWTRSTKFDSNFESEKLKAPWVHPGPTLEPIWNQVRESGSRLWSPDPHWDQALMAYDPPCLNLTPGIVPNYSNVARMSYVAPCLNFVLDALERFRGRPGQKIVRRSSGG